MKKLSLCYSSVKKNYNKLYIKLTELKNLIDLEGLTEFVDILVVVQYSTSNASFNKNKINFVFSKKTGLSKSRNLVISESCSEYIWFLDDDSFPNISDLKSVLHTLESRKSDIYIGQVRCSDSKGHYKNYKRFRMGKLGLLRVNSIEIIINKKFVVNSGIEFNENLGLGTTNPASEENCFLLDLYNAGAEICYINKSIVSHPCKNVERQIRTKNNLNSIMLTKGFLANKVGGLIGLILMLYWQFRFFLIYKKASVFLNIAKGYLKGVK